MAIEFKVVNTPRHDRFEETICKLLNEGWSLHGSPFISQTGGMTQALLRETKASVVKKPVKVVNSEK
mgnify:CR=1 FL=1|jgi:hypothetical protein|tara:strand:- start:1436 stop:1636 length:201 start_codon:yes stop_codon:yes gene_type:complete